MTLSAGLLPYRRGPRGLELLIAHPGGPLWARKDAGAWSLIKGETQATIRNIPMGYEQPPGKPCIKCGKPATVSAWFAKSY